MSFDVAPEGVLLTLLGDDGKRPNTGLWHLADARRARTLCGLDVGYGMPRLSWELTQEGSRCQMCVAQLGGRNRPRG